MHCSLERPAVTSQREERTRMCSPVLHDDASCALTCDDVDVGGEVVR